VRIASNKTDTYHYSTYDTVDTIRNMRHDIMLSLSG